VRLECSGVGADTKSHGVHIQICGEDIRKETGEGRTRRERDVERDGRV
jgi:hypothetical protein